MTRRAHCPRCRLPLPSRYSENALHPVVWVAVGVMVSLIAVVVAVLTRGAG